MSRTKGIADGIGWSSRQGLQGEPTNLNPKGGGESSMLVKRGTPEGVYDVALQHLSDMVKAGLPEPQCPVVEMHTRR